jgi:hypothetical protein
MTDLELIELAAKAARLMWHDGHIWLDADADYVLWNPLTDDGDALRLAVKLNLVIQPYYYYDERRQQPATATRSGGGMIKNIVGIFPTYSESFTQYSPEEATRRAIVRAAAEIGKEMK